MENKRGRGRQPVPKGDKKKPVTIWVKTKHVPSAKKDCKEIQIKYEALT